MKISDLCVDHPYYCSDSNYYSNEANSTWNNWEEFYSSMGHSDVDMNLCFRWDMGKNEDDGTYNMSIFIMQQRKGKFCPHYIKLVTDDDCEQIMEYLDRHLERMIKLWEPMDIVSKIRDKKLNQILK